jgi:hypothetical protein
MLRRSYNNTKNKIQMNNPKPTKLENLKTGVELTFIVAGIWILCECVFRACNIPSVIF